MKHQEKGQKGEPICLRLVVLKGLKKAVPSTLQEVQQVHVSLTYEEILKPRNHEHSELVRVDDSLKAIHPQSSEEKRLKWLRKV